MRSGETELCFDAVPQVIPSNRRIPTRMPPYRGSIDHHGPRSLRCGEEGSPGIAVAVGHVGPGDVAPILWWTAPTLHEVDVCARREEAGKCCGYRLLVHIVPAGFGVHIHSTGHRRGSTIGFAGALYRTCRRAPATRATPLNPAGHRAGGHCFALILLRPARRREHEADVVVRYAPTDTAGGLVQFGKGPLLAVEQRSLRPHCRPAGLCVRCNHLTVLAIDDQSALR